MIYFLVAFGLLLHVLFWGAGLALLVMPRPWRAFWPVLAAPAGLALQSAVVWLGAYADLPGTNSYAWWSELLPAVLLAVALRRHGLRRSSREVGRLGLVWLAMAVALSALVWPLSRAAKGLTTASLGSCDAADYAAGARVFKEFARSDRTGFLGHTEVVRVMSADNFPDFWLQLNHFTPSALIALNGTVFDSRPHQITGVLTAVLLVLSLPVVFWMARTLLRFPARTACGIAALYGLTPLTWYAVYQVAMGQLLAVPAIGLLTWAGVALWRGALTWRRGLAFGGVLAVAFSLILASYNFMIVVCLVPAVAFAGGQTLGRGQWRRFGRWFLLMAAPLVLAGLFYLDRVLGLAERIVLFRQFDFGWRIPALTPEGWLGVVRDVGLVPWADWLRWLVSVAVLVLLVRALLVAAKKRKADAWLALCLMLPALAGYGYLILRGELMGTHASYDAYKIISVFLPGLWCGLSCWLIPAWQAGVRWHRAALVLAGAVTLFNLNAAWAGARKMATPPLLVGAELAGLQKLERNADLTSLNLRVEDFWSRLWANAFLLKKPQYFATHTYEGRLNTALKGEWDLNGGLVQVRLPDPGDSVTVNTHYSLVRTESPVYLRAELGDGWHELERTPNTPARWRWTRGDATVRLTNPHPHPLRISSKISVRSLVPRDLQVWLNGGQVFSVPVGAGRETIEVPAAILPSGESVLDLRSPTPPSSPGPGDTRPLVFAIDRFEVEALGEAPAVRP